MKKIVLMLTALTVFLTSVFSYSQNAVEIEWLSQLDKKSAASYGDAVTLFMYQLNKPSSGFEQDSATLSSEGIALRSYSRESFLTKGMLSKMTSVYLKLSGSLMYNITGFERYAFKACIAEGIFSDEGSESDIVSGPVLIEVFSKISESMGGQK